MTKVKICGLRRKEDIEFANRLLPEYAGFVFADSIRQVTGEQAQQLRLQLDLRINAVGVFVQEEIGFIKQLATARIIDMVQLHGDEIPEYCQEVRRQVKLPIIKVLRVRDAASLAGAADYDCDYLLLDTYTKSAYGGSGQRFAIELLSEASLPKPYFIAGGLNAENVQSVLVSAPYAVDVSGGVETEGRKDFKKMQAFVANVKGSKAND